MRLPALSSAFVLTALQMVPVGAQAVLPARSFAPTPVVIAAPEIPPVAEWWRMGGPRIRLLDDRVTALLSEGLTRSPLLRALVERIEAGNVIVYVGMTDRLDKGLAGCLTFIGDAGRYRYLRALINPELTTDLAIASLAHELHHVTEVIAHPGVRSETALESLYRRIGRENRVRGRRGWETAAAQQVTDDVRRELKLGVAAMVASREADAPRQ